MGKREENKGGKLYGCDFQELTLSRVKSSVNGCTVQHVHLLAVALSYSHLGIDSKVVHDKLRELSYVKN